jgi:hypothetical protein
MSVYLRWYKDQLPATVCDDTCGYLNTHPIVTKSVLEKHGKMHVFQNTIKYTSNTQYTVNQILNLSKHKEFK